MKLPRHIICNIFAALIVGSIFCFLYRAHVLKGLDLAMLDFFARRHQSAAADNRIVIIEITDEDIQALGGWPLKRSWHADLCAALSEMGARAVFYDTLFSGPSTEEDDAQFEKAMARRRMVYLPSSFLNHSYRFDEALFPLERFAAAMKGTGSIELIPDSDGVIRDIPLFLRVEGRFYPSLPLRVYMDAEGYEIRGCQDRMLLVGAARDEVRIPLNEHSRFMVKWPGPWRLVFKHFSFLEVLQGSAALHAGRSGPVRADDFTDKICLIGLTARSLNEVRPVSIEAECPRVAIFAAALSNLFSRSFFPVGSTRLNMLLIFILALVPMLVMAGLRPMEEILILSAFGAVYFYACLLLFNRGIYINCVYPLTALLVAYLVIASVNLWHISLERQEFFAMSVTDSLTGMYNIRYFRMLLDTEIMISKPDPNSRFCVVMLDLDNFKHVNDTFGHLAGDLVLRESGQVLRSCVRSSDIIARYGGEEIIVLLRGALLKDALAVAEKMRKSIENHLFRDSRVSIAATVSLGVTSFQHDDDTESLIKRADDGLYQAKTSGKNRVCSVDMSV